MNDALPIGWRHLPIAAIADFGSGDSISVATLSQQSGRHPIPVFGGNGVAGYTSAPTVIEPTVILGRVGQKCGVVYQNTGAAWITDNALYARRFRRAVDVRFLALALEAARLNEVKNKNDLPLITQSILNDVKIAWPDSRDEQRSIANAVSDADDLIASLDRVIAKKRDVKQGTMQELLTGGSHLPGFRSQWKRRQLGEVGAVTMGQSPSGRSYNTSAVGVPLIQGNADIQSRHTFDRVWTTEPTRVVRTGDVVMTVRAPVGYTATATSDACLGRGVCGISAGRSTQFLFHALVAAEPRWALLEQGSTFTAVNSRQVREFQIWWPDEETVRREISSVLDDADAEIGALELRLDKARAVKQGMVQELLTGRTRLPLEGVTA